ncbi:MAG: TIGR04283 family arsenosugar biosynthesis glycosyltransferase [Flavobacteriaceae bacterium]
MISIIIPVLNEALGIERLLSHLVENASQGIISEVIIVDGGSTDATSSLVLAFSKKLPIQILNSAKGRAVQMNMGAKNATGDILYFLHADSFPPKHFDRLIVNEVAKGNPAGCFRMQFDSNHPILKASGWLTRFNFKICRGGDQSLFVKKSLFEKLNGYNEAYTVYEDCDFINKLYDQASFTIIPKKLITSARRYQTHGAIRLQFHFAIIHCKKWLGASPRSLQKYYSKYISLP